jgi:hypothetical protein
LSGGENQRAARPTTSFSWKRAQQTPGVADGIFASAGSIDGAGDNSAAGTIVDDWLRSQTSASL